VNIADGSLKLIGGPTLRINDPNAVFSKGYTAHKEFTADDENPSITAFSGFPMCIPRSSDDPLCPQSNRPAGQRTFAAPDPLVMAPFAAGDALEYSGIRVNGEIIAYEVTALNVQITTSGVPAYIRMEDAIIGVFSNDPNSEFGDTRFIGYVSDPSVSVLVNAIDVNPCTGEETYRTIGAASPKAGEARNKFTFRADSTQISKYTREYRITVSTGQKETKNGLIAGQYVQPVTEWIYPELLTPGIDPPALFFDQHTFLTKGWFLDGKSYGPLNPWPGANVPPALDCAGQTPASSATPTQTESTTGTPAPPATPIANAGADVTQRPGVPLVLTGANDAKDVPNDKVSYAWKQVSGPTVTLTSAGAAKATFTPPSQPSATPIITRIFQLNVSRTDFPGQGLWSVDNVTVVTDRSIKDVVTIDSYTWTTTQSGTIAVTCHSNVVNGDNAAMTLTIDGGSARTVQMTNQGGGFWSYSARSVKKPNTVTCRSDLGGTASTTTTTARRRKRGEYGVEDSVEELMIDA
jgi:hypothetical protein